MKTSIRFLTSLVSSLLVSAGLSRAAAYFDPLSRLSVSRFHDMGPAEAMAQSCVFPCALPETLTGVMA